MNPHARHGARGNGAVGRRGSDMAQTRVTDATGRTVAVPATVERVLAAGPPASVILLALVPQKLIGWTRAPGRNL